MKLTRYDQLGHRQFGWLEARHHFSFGDYQDPDRMGFGALRVWNDDIIQPHTGFDPHPHRHMEIVTYIRHGAISHKDNAGHEGRTDAGNIQVMSAGSGIVHSEHNLEDQETRLFQIWFLPREGGGQPRWENREFPQQRTGFITVASGYQDDQDKGAVWMNSDAALKAGNFTKGEVVLADHPNPRQRYLVVDDGQIDGTDENNQNGFQLNKGDSLYLEHGEAVRLTAASDCKIVMAEMA